MKGGFIKIGADGQRLKKEEKGEAKVSNEKGAKYKVVR